MCCKALRQTGAICFKPNSFVPHESLTDIYSLGSNPKRSLSLQAQSRQEMAAGQQPNVDGHTGSPPRRDKPKMDPAAVHEQCERILGDPLFSHSKRYGSLLKYIVDHTLAGQYDCLKERIIGIEVFGRPADFDASQDTTIRSSITLVRKRLAQYFEDPRHQSELRIDLPVGSYIAEFSAPQNLSKVQPSTPGRRSFSKLYVGIPIAAVILLLAVWAAIRLTPSNPVDKFWAPILHSPGIVMICIGSPATPPSHPNGALPASESGEVSLDYFISQQTDYPVAELKAASSIASYLSSNGRQSVLRMAQTTVLSDLRGSPAVVLGSYPNQWALRLVSGLRFRFRPQEGGPIHWIEDSNNPRNQSWAVNSDLPYKQVTSEYALITREFDPTTGQWWIGIGGTTVFGTIGAQQMLMDPNAMTTLNSQLPRGWEHKNLQIVLEFRMVDGSLGTSHVVATNSW